MVYISRSSFLFIFIIFINISTRMYEDDNVMPVFVHENHETCWKSILINNTYVSKLNNFFVRSFVFKIFKLFPTVFFTQFYNSFVRSMITKSDHDLCDKIYNTICLRTNRTSSDRIFMFLHIFTENMKLQLGELSRRFVFLWTDVQTFLAHKKNVF